MIFTQFGDQIWFAKQSSQVVQNLRTYALIYLNRTWVVHVGHHSTPFFVQITTFDIIQHGGGRRVEFIFIKAISPE